MMLVRSRGTLLMRNYSAVVLDMLLVSVISLLPSAMSAIITSEVRRPHEITCTSEREVCLPANYSRFQLPNKGKTTIVSIGLDGFDVRKIDDIEYTVEISCYFLTKWRDDRLLLHEDILKVGEQAAATAAINGTAIEETWFPIDLEFVSKVWLPDVEVLNLKEFKSLDVLDKLQGLWVSQNSEVLYVLAARITFICAMTFEAFPLDVQTCLFQVGSFNFDNRKMVFESYLVPVMPNHTKSILDYDVQITTLRPEATFFVPAETGNYSVTGFEMIMKRRVSHYMITYYLPSSLFVVVSWTSFLIPSDDIQGRMALLVTLFLVLVNIFNTTTTNSPKADGLNAMQSWVICCIFFVFGALFEYAIILLQMKIKTFRKLAASMVKDETCAMDVAVLIAFPCVFLIFNFVYWAAFLIH